MSLLDTLYLKIHTLKSAHSQWESLTTEFKQRSGVVAIELRRKLQGLCCGDKADVRVHFSKMKLMHQELALFGQFISDTDYAAILLSPLPSTYDSTISSLVSAKMNYRTITPQIVKSSITDDYDTRHTKSRKSSNTTANDDVTYSAQSKKNLLCTNCNKKGHMKENCWVEGGDKAGQGPKGRGNHKGKGKGKGTEKAAKAAEKDEKPDSVWLVQVDDDEDWFVELTDKDTPDLIYDAEDAYTKTFSHVLLAGEDLNPSERMELFDSGASRHMSSYRNQFIDYKAIVPKSITAADNHTFQAIGKGDLMISIPNGKSVTRIRLKDVLYAPKMGITLISISKLDVAGFAALFRDKCCQIFSEKRKKLGEVPLTKGLYCLKSARKPFVGLTKASDTLTMAEIHSRLGHLAPEAIRKMLKDRTITGITLDDTHATMGTCDSCEYAKTTCKPIGKLCDPPRCEKLSDEIHTDLWGPSPVQTSAHSRYYVSFTDDFTRFTKLYLLKLKSDTFDSYQAYEAWLSTQHDMKIKCLRLDRGGEYMSEEFTKYLKLKGTEHHITVHDTPEHNGVAERLNQMLAEHVRAMLHASGLLKSLWGEAMMHVTWLKNCSSTCRLGNKTPYEVLYNKKPDLQKLPVWGCQVKVHDITGSKLDMCARDGHWVGFDPESDGHHIYCVDHRTVGVERSVVFKQQSDIMISTSVSAQPEGEKGNSLDGSNGESNADSADVSMSSNKPVHEVSQCTTPGDNTPNHLGNAFEPPPLEPILRRSTWQCFESEYFKRLNAGEGTMDRQTTHLNEMAKATIEDLFDGTTRTGECPDEDDVIFVMVAGVAEVEVLDPSTVDEA